MHAGRLVVVCGAGLSVAPPSRIPMAVKVAELCFDAYQLKVDPQLDPRLRQDLGALAEYFYDLQTLKTQFIDTLVPWGEFVRPPNPGHAAIADFLMTRAVTAAITTNFDHLIERSAWDYGADFSGSLDGDEASLSSRSHGPLLKIHGCSNRDRGTTVWAQSQLRDPEIAERVKKSEIWMAANLRNKDLLVVGFWSDWGYLNHVVSSALGGIHPHSVTVIDLSTTDELETKAPGLWSIANRAGVRFEHIRESGADVLDELRKAFSENYLRQMVAAGCNAFTEATGVVCDPSWFNVDGLGSEALYGWRRDAEGVPRSKPATEIRPSNTEAVGYFHLLLRRAGAVPVSGGYSYADQLIRVVNAAGHVLSSIAQQFVEAPSIESEDLVVAVGAIDLGLPANVVRSGHQGSVVRPATVAKWLTTERAKEELGI